MFIKGYDRGSRETTTVAPGRSRGESTLKHCYNHHRNFSDEKSASRELTLSNATSVAALGRHANMGRTPPGWSTWMRP